MVCNRTRRYRHRDMTQPITVLLVDHEDGARQRIRRALAGEPDFAVVAEAGSSDDAVELAQAYRPDLIVLDDDGGAIAELRRSSPASRLVVLVPPGSGAGEPAVLSVDRRLSRSQPTWELVTSLRALVPVAADRHEGADEIVPLVAHDLRGPLAAVYGAAVTLRRSFAELDDATRLQLVGIIERQAAHMTHLVDDLLTAARLEEGRAARAHEAVDIAPVLARLPDLADRPGDVQVDTPSLLVDVSDVALERMVHNLVTNALTHGCPPVTVAATQTDDTVEVAVRDHGDGIDPAVEPVLFHRFSPAAKGQSGSTGLGLYIVRLLARSNGGDVRYEPAHPGARFVLSLPAAARGGGGRSPSG